MSQIIDRRLNGKNKSAVNRQRFIRRFKAQIKKAVAEAVSERSIKEINSGEQINIPAGDISEPVFRHGVGGEREAVHPGNAEYVAGDKIKRPPESGGGRSRATNSGEGLDDFIFNLSREEFLEFFFEDLALPDLVKKQLATNVEFKSVRAGYSRDGVPTNINVVRSLKGALARRTALRAPYNARLRTAEESLALLPALEGETEDEDIATRRAELEEEILHLRERIGAVPFIDTFDLRYNNRIRQPKPTSRAVMFCLMDVSGSMDEERKDIAKRFFILLYLFLTRNYERTDVVFIRHHTTAKEVDEEEFFHSRETGGTVVSSALQLMHEIICARYPTADWNIYAAQASDGDNWNDDSPLCRDLLATKIMPLLQYFAYVEITPEEHQSLWREYQGVKGLHRNFAMQRIDDLSDIYPVFRSLFKKKAS